MSNTAPDRAIRQCMSPRSVQNRNAAAGTAVNTTVSTAATTPSNGPIDSSVSVCRRIIISLRFASRLTTRLSPDVTTPVRPMIPWSEVARYRQEFACPFGGLRNSSRMEEIEPAESECEPILRIYFDSCCRPYAAGCCNHFFNRFDFFAGSGKGRRYRCVIARHCKGQTTSRATEEWGPGTNTECHWSDAETRSSP